MDANRMRAVERYSAGDARRAEEAHAGQFIRLRYSMQFTSGGRAHTIEMEVSVPVGASAEQREQLIREAEANMEQLYRRVEARARGQRPTETAQRGTPQQPAQPASASSSAQPSPAPRPSLPDQRPLQSAPAPSVAASATPEIPAAREGPQAISFSDRHAVASSTASAGSSAAQSAPASQVRSGISQELPVAPGMASMGTGPMKLSEFIQIVRDNWGLAPKEAMDLLQVKSLNNMNYRDLLRQLEALVAQRASGIANATSATHQPASLASPAAPVTPRREQAQPVRPTVPPAKAQQPSAAPRSQDASPARAPSPPSPQLEGPANIPVYPLSEHTIREPGRVYKFDEEEDEQEEQQVGVDVTEEEGSMSEAMARIKIDELRDMRGTAAANQGRLKVLHNLLDSQISDEQFLQLIQRLWRITSDKNLKQDQVEALISWSKEDYFEDEVRAVLAVLNEQT